MQSLLDLKSISQLSKKKKKKRKKLKKKKKKGEEVVLSGKSKLNTIEVLIFKSSINSYISHDKFVSVKNVLREYNEMKEEIKIPETPVKYII